jgi:hypothetical protein
MAFKKTKSLQQLGEWAFIAGVILAILVGLVPQVFPTQPVAIVLVVLGALVGLLHIGDKKAHDFLLAAVALLVAGAAGLQTLPLVGSYLGPILANIISFVAPAAVIVALKAVYELGR